MEEWLGQYGSIGGFGSYQNSGSQWINNLFISYEGNLFLTLAESTGFPVSRQAPGSEKNGLLMQKEKILYKSVGFSSPI